MSYKRKVAGIAILSLMIVTAGLIIKSENKRSDDRIKAPIPGDYETVKEHCQDKGGELINGSESNHTGQGIYCKIS